MAEHGELHFSRVFDAPRELVFACMTDPDHLAHFWGPVGVSAPRERIAVLVCGANTTAVSFD